MREKLATLPLTQLRELAKSQQIKSINTLRKAELIERLCEEAKKQEEEKAKKQEELKKQEEERRQEEIKRVEEIRKQDDSRKPVPPSPSQDSQRNIQRTLQAYNSSADPKAELQDLDSGIEAHGILEIMPDGFGFIRCENYLPGDNDVYVAPSQIRRFNMKTGDIIRGSRRVKTASEKFAALLYVNTVNGYPTSIVEKRPKKEFYQNSIVTSSYNLKPFVW